MFTSLFVNGVYRASAEGWVSVSLASTDTEAKYQCRTCGDVLTETTRGVEGDTPCVYGEDGDGPHDPERVCLSWYNSAGVIVDDATDSVTLRISVGDPRGAFVFTATRVPDDADGPLAGRLVLNTPYPGEAFPHVPLHQVQPGTYVIGEPSPHVPENADGHSG